MDLFHNKTINQNYVSVNTIKRLLDDEGLNAYIPRIILLILETNKEKWLDICQKTKSWTKKWKRVLFTDWSMMCTEAFHLRYVCRHHGKLLSEEYSPKKTMFNWGKRALTRAAISHDGPKQLYFIEGTEDRDCCENILDACHPEISRGFRAESWYSCMITLNLTRG
jgi:hypothetical protein